MIVTRRILDSVSATLGRMTMYRLVLSCLGALAGLSLIASLFDLIAYRPAALVLSLLVPLLTSFISNRVIASIFQVTPHSESSLITGYLLFFIFPPSTDPAALLGLALAAIFASGSKYLLALRGRHIFNPAAAGAFALTLCGVYYSGWWIGNPIMLPFTVIGALLILQRTRRLPMAGVFLAVSVGIMATRSLFLGLPIGTALLWPFTSSPAIFFVGFMLSEPLTQPPLRRQQFLMAGVVGALFSIPLHLGHIYVAPESALLIGNALAFAFGQKKGIALTLRRRTDITPTTVEFSFTPLRKVVFRSGQYLELTLPHRGSDSRGLRRVFSIASPASDPGRVAISTKIPEDASTFKQALDELQPGATITATTIAGDFLLPGDLSAPVLLVAGGIGITPFASQLADPVPGRDVVLIYSVTSASEIGYRQVLLASGATVIVVSPDPIADLPDGWIGISGRRIDADLIAEQVPDIRCRQVYVSGPPNMVNGVGTAARRLEAAGVRTDYFSGY